MTILRTPEQHFENLPGYPFVPHYLDLPKAGMRMHYVAEGAADAPIVLLLHGEPSWSYLYRKMIPVFVQNGYRAIAPDLIGFGKSDKPTAQEDYTYRRHLDWLNEFVAELDLQNVLLFCQDWGGLLGLRVVADQPERFSQIVTANTFLPTGMQEASASFLEWRQFVQKVPHFDVGRIINRATETELSPEVIQAYDAPFPDETYKAGARQFPLLVPIHPEDPESQPNLAAWEFFRQWNKPFLTLFSDSDPITKGGEKAFQKIVPGATGQAHEIIQQAGHFLQEDKGEEIATKVVQWAQSLT